jgi:hypothetical protein
MDNGLSIAPSIGFGYSHAHKTSYQTTGDSGMNGVTKLGADNNTTLNIGTTVTKIFNISDLSVMPDVHFGMEYDFSGGKQKNSIQLTGMSSAYSFTNSPASKKLCNFGAGVKVISGNVNISASYNSYFSKKYFAQQGSLKLVVNM